MGEFLGNLWLMVTAAIQKLEDVMLGKARLAVFDREHLVKGLTKEALAREDGTAIARLGPAIPYLYSNLAVIVPKSTQQMHHLVDCIESQSNGRKILKPLADMVEHNTMANMTVAEGALMQRKLLVPFTSDVHGFMQIGREMFNKALQEWAQQKDGFVLLDEIKYLVRAMSAKRILGAEMTKKENHIIEESLMAVKARTTSLSPFPSAQFQQTKNIYRLFSNNLINNTQHEILNGIESQSRKENFFAEIIKNMTDYKNNSQNPHDYIHHPLVTSSMLVIATLDGIYTNLTAILLQLLSHPSIYEKLYHECMEVSDGHSIDDDVLKDKHAMPYLHLVYMEGLRFNSSLPILARYTEDGIHTEETEVPAYSNVLINLRAMHFDVDKWGHDADEFIPERFLRPELQDIQIGKAPFIPFSLGQRQCPGIRVGETMIKLFITELILNYTMSAIPNQSPPRVDEVSLAPDPGPGYKVTIAAREHSLTYGKR